MHPTGLFGEQHFALARDGTHHADLGIRALGCAQKPERHQLLQSLIVLSIALAPGGMLPKIGSALDAACTHQFPNLERIVVYERGLRAMLRRLPGRKIVFSNAPLHYTEAILALTGIVDCFDAVYTVERVRFQPKPAVGGFRHLLRAERLTAQRCIMVEDSLPNLQTAKRLGMKTVWVSTNTRQPSYVDARLASVLDLPQRLSRL